MKKGTIMAKSDNRLMDDKMVEAIKIMREYCSMNDCDHCIMWRKFGKPKEKNVRLCPIADWDVSPIEWPKLGDEMLFIDTVVNEKGKKTLVCNLRRPV